jgi:hypothetical protein
MKVVAVTASVFRHQQQGFLDEGFDAFIDKPLRAEQLVECLARQLGAVFAEAGAGPPAVEPEAGDWGELVLPGALAAQLRAALHIHSVSALNRGIEALAGLGGPARRLAEHLRGLAAQFDLEQVEQVLAGVPMDADPVPALGAE